MNQTQEYLKYLLNREQWTIEEKEWILNYLEGNDLTDLEAVAAGEFHTDLVDIKRRLDRKISEDILQKIHQRIQPVQPMEPVFERRPRFGWIKWAAAAIIIIIAGAAYFLTNRSGGVEYNQLASTVAHEWKMVRLPDGSMVNLQPQSSLRYPGRFNGNTREVKLTGEAFFEVAKDAQHPFIVHTDLLNTTVLGTSFNVEAQGAEKVSVVVVNGTVKVATAGEGKEQEEVVLHKNQGVDYDRGINKLEVKDASADALYIEQRSNGKFEYNGESIKKVIADMQRFYNTSITLRDELQRCVFFGRINTSDDLDKALRLISVTLGATVTRDSTAGNYIISGGSCQ